MNPFDMAQPDGARLEREWESAPGQDAAGPDQGSRAAWASLMRDEIDQAREARAFRWLQEQARGGTSGARIKQWLMASPVLDVVEAAMAEAAEVARVKAQAPLRATLADWPPGTPVWVRWTATRRRPGLVSALTPKRVRVRLVDVTGVFTTVQPSSLSPRHPDEWVAPAG